MMMLKKRTIRVALNLDNHLFQTKKRLLASLLGQFLVKVFLALFLDLDTFLLRLLWHVCGRFVAEIISSRVSLASSLVRITLFGSLSNIASSLFDIGAAKWLLLIILGFGLILQVLARKVWGFVPSIVGSGLVDLAEIVFGWVDTVGSILRGITSDVSKENSSILDCDDD